MRNFITVLFLCLFLQNLFAQGIQDERADENPLELKKVVILTSGLAYYEHSGSISGNVNIPLLFKYNSVNDALKTLVVNDPSSANPVVRYQLENSFIETSQIAINTSSGIRIFDINSIRSIRFTDPEIEREVKRALESIDETGAESRRLILNLPGTNQRNVSISYVIPSPVWKVSYRLDLGQQRPLFQGWAIVDNDSDTDWNNITLSLAAGRPVSFIQNLYPPYYVARPVLPLSIAGAAVAQAHDRGYAVQNFRGSSGQDEAVLYSVMEEMETAPADALRRNSLLTSASTNVAGGAVETATGQDAGGQFEFTIKTPVTLNRRMSAMFPLVESRIEARKTLIYNGRGRYPRLGAEITNNSGMKLPAGPITVYDGGIYAGDALIEFWNENEKRLISFGEDLTVSASMNSTNTTAVSTVTVSGGVMTINRTISFSTAYTFINSDSSAKNLVVEKDKIANATLSSPNSSEETTTAYRFTVNLPGSRETVFTVVEQRPMSERITLLSQRPESILSYSTNQEIPQRVRTALQRAVELRQAVDTANNNIRNIESDRNRQIAEQDRIRRNLEAVGNQSAQGQEYLRRLTALDTEIDELTRNLERANTNARTAQTAYENYLNGLNL
ncbi:MAG: DUF4139 domain-containing protein [Treponema sp.]|jgi:hypothetical protein|nr:DUF4139 domain-containing protein [Treponema sp.]